MSVVLLWLHSLCRTQSNQAFHQQPELIEPKQQRTNSNVKMVITV